MVPESEVDDFFAEINAIVAQFPEDINKAALNHRTSEKRNKRSHSNGSIKRLHENEADNHIHTDGKKLRRKTSICKEEEEITKENTDDELVDKIEYLTEYVGTRTNDVEDAIKTMDHHSPEQAIDEIIKDANKEEEEATTATEAADESNNLLKEQKSLNEISNVIIGPQLPTIDDFQTNEVLSCQQQQPSEEEIQRRTKIIHETFQTIASKVSVLGETQPSLLQILLIQLMTRIADWECGALSLSYIETCLSHTESQMKEYETTLLPSGWLSHWCKEKCAYFYENCNDGSRQWHFPTESSTNLANSPAVGKIVDDLPASSSLLLSNPTRTAMEDGEIVDSEEEDEEEEKENTINPEELLEELFDQARASSSVQLDSATTKTEVKPTSEQLVTDMSNRIQSVDSTIMTMSLLMQPAEFLLAAMRSNSQGSNLKSQKSSENDNKSSLLVGYSSSEEESEDDQSTSAVESVSSSSSTTSDDEQSSSAGEEEEEEQEDEGKKSEIGPQLPELQTSTHDMDIETSDEETITTTSTTSQHNVPANLDDALKEWEKMKMTL